MRRTPISGPVTVRFDLPPPQDVRSAARSARRGLAPGQLDALGHDQDDAEQELHLRVLLQAHRRPGQRTGYYATVLWSGVSQIRRDRGRAAKRGVIWDQGPGDEPWEGISPDPAPDEVMHARACAEVLERGLSAQELELLELISERSLRECGALLGVSHESVHQRLKRARATAARLLGEMNDDVVCGC